MKKHRTIEGALILLAIILILVSIILVKNPTIVGYATKVEYSEYNSHINLEPNSIPINLDKQEYDKLLSNKLELQKQG